MSKHKSPPVEPLAPEPVKSAAVDVWELSMSLREAAMANPVKAFPPGMISEDPEGSKPPEASERPDAPAAPNTGQSGSHPA